MVHCITYDLIRGWLLFIQFWILKEKNVQRLQYVLYHSIISMRNCCGSGSIGKVMLLRLINTAKYTKIRGRWFEAVVQRQTPPAIIIETFKIIIKKRDTRFKNVILTRAWNWAPQPTFFTLNWIFHLEKSLSVVKIYGFHHRPPSKMWRNLIGLVYYY